MKNVKLNLKKAAKAGFSLVEMLVVIAVIGVIAAIAIPNVGNINTSARTAAATRNAQTIASTMNAAIAAGYDAASMATIADVIAAVQDGTVVPDKGSFKDKVFTTGTIEQESLDLIATQNMLSWDANNQQVAYHAPAN